MSEQEKQPASAGQESKEEPTTEAKPEKKEEDHQGKEPSPPATTEGEKEETTTEPEETKAEPELDLQVGLWRGQWPTQLSCIICIEDNICVRYFSSQRMLDMVQYDVSQKAFVTITETNLGQLELPPLFSLHHFEIRSESYVIGLAEDNKRFVVFRTSDKRFQETTSGSLPHTTTHLVVFQYRATHYALAYNSGMGEYTVLSMGPLVAGEMNAAIASRGRFRQGWSDIVWKGTHHVRCTRQRFFCYSSVSGEVAFECVYVRGGSTSSSICSAEHVQMPAKESDKPIQQTLKRKGCIAVPIQLGGKIACLLYSHSDLKAGGGGKAGDKSTSKLPTGAYGAGATTNVAASASLLLQKKIFAHKEPWTHFVMIGRGNEISGQGEQHAADDHMVCYSANSGQVWVNRIFHSSAPVKEITLMDDEDPNSPLHAGPSAERRKKPSKHSSALTREMLGAVGEEPMSVEQYAQSTQPPPNERGAEKTQKENQQEKNTNNSTQRSHANQQNQKNQQHQHRGHSAASNRPKNSFMGPITPRPPSSNRSLRERLASVKTSGDYHADITKVIEELRRTDFAPGSPVVAMALEEVPQLAEDDENDVLSGSGSNRRAHSARGASSPGKAPWRDVIGCKEKAPPPRHSWLVKFEKEYEKHREEEVPAMKLEHKQMMRLHQPVMTREQFQAKKFEAIDRERESKMIGANKEDPHNPKPVPDGRKVQKTVKRLAEDDVSTRAKKKELSEKKYKFDPPASKKLEDEDQEALTKRISDDSVIQHEKRLEALRKKYQSGPKPEEKVKVAEPLSPEKQKQLATRLVDQAVEKHKAAVDKVFHDMTDKHLPKLVKRPPGEISEKAARLTKGESAMEKAK